MVYLTGDRQNLQTVVAADVHSIVHSHLSILDGESVLPDETPKHIGLYVYTMGGITTAAWGLVNLIREFGEELSVFVPYKALSAGTLLALGADHVYMSRLGQLSPIDPSLNSPYNPPVPNLPPGAPPQFLPVSVEAVIGFINLARKEMNLHEDGALAEVFAGLTEKVHPLALGDVYRSREQITSLAERLLRMGSRKLSDPDIKRIVEILTKGLGSHDYIMNRKEARQLLGDWVVRPDPKIEKDMMALFSEYSKILHLNTQQNPDEDLEGSKERVLTYVRAIVESRERLDGYISIRKIRKLSVPAPGPVPMQVEGFQQSLIKEGWQCLDGGA